MDTINTSPDIIESTIFELLLPSGQIEGYIVTIYTREGDYLRVGGPVWNKHIGTIGSVLTYDMQPLHVNTFYIKFVVPHIIRADFNTLGDIFDDINLEAIHFGDPDFDIECGSADEVFYAQFHSELLARLNEPDTSIDVTLVYSISAWDYIIGGTIHPGG
jgi:hypothetical protein